MQALGGNRVREGLRSYAFMAGRVAVRKRVRGDKVKDKAGGRRVGKAVDLEDGGSVLWWEREPGNASD